MSTKARKLTFEDWLAMPETKQPYEIVDGVLYEYPTPTPSYQWIVGEVSSLLGNYIEDNDLGVVLVAPVDLLIQRELLRVRQPRILYLSGKRTGIWGRAGLRGLQFLEVPPDLVVEVLSPSNTRRDLAEKLEDYRKLGVLECWLVSPEAETIEVVDLSGEAPTTSGVFAVDGTLQSQVLTDFTLELHEVFR